MRVLRPSNSYRYATQYVIPSFRSGRVSVSVWGCFLGNLKGPLVVLEGNLNGRAYTNILQDKLLPFMASVQPQINDLKFQHDGAPAHRSLLARKWIDDNSVDCLKWPACSPDINTIENVWHRMKCIISKQNPRPNNVDELKKAIYEAWNQISADELNCLVESVARRIKLVLRVKGFHTKY